jgi:hypothetical protein
MKQTTFPVSPAFIVEAHKQACSEWKTKLETTFPEAFKSDATFKLGDRVVMTSTAFADTTYILACFDTYKIGLISLTTGNRWTSPVEVARVHAITVDELERICDYQDLQSIEVNGAKIPSGKPSTEKTLTASKEMILEAYDATSSYTVREMIKKEFPDAFNKYVQLVDGPASEGHSLSLSTVGPEVDGVNIMIGFGIAPKELKLSCLAVSDHDCEVELIKENGYTFIAFKKK